MVIADIFLAVEQNGAVEAITGTPVKLGNDHGVFASIDWQIRDIPEAIRRIDAEGVAKDQEEAQITVALTLPWDQAERYTAVQEELAALNAELSKTNADRASQPTDSITPTTEASAQFADTAALEIVETSDVDATALQVALLPQLPPAALPEPSDLAAMELAMAQLAATHSLTAAEEAEIAAQLVAEADADAQMAAIDAPAAPEALEQPVTLEIQPVRIVLTQADVVRAAHTSRSTLVFGSMEHIGQIKGKRAAKPAKRTGAEMATMDLFAIAAAPAQVQLTLF
jgi:hypothetical protein